MGAFSQLSGVYGASQSESRTLFICDQLEDIEITYKGTSIAEQNLYKTCSEEDLVQVSCSERGTRPILCRWNAPLYVFWKRSERTLDDG